MGLSISINEAAAFNVTVAIPGPQGAQGPAGPQGPIGPAGPGVPTGGLSGQILSKASNANYDTSWVNITDVSAVWGQITGSLSNQIDLSNALAAKYDASNPAGYITGVNWGSIGGSITSQLDLQTALGGKADLTGATFTGGISTQSGSNIIGIDPLGTWVQITDGTDAISLSPSGITYPDFTVQTTAFTGTAASTWGQIGGLLANQTDLSTELSGKAPAAAGIPVGGITGQLLAKASNNNYDSAWTTVIPGDRYLSTSSTSLLIGNGTKTLTIGTGLSYSATQDITVALTSDPNNYHMHGKVTSYVAGTGVLVIDVQSHTGSGTFNAWTVNVGGLSPVASLAWGNITGTLSNQIDLQTALDGKYSTSNPAGYITSSALSPYLLSSTAASTYYPLTNPSGYITSSALTGYAQLSGATYTGKVNLPTRIAGGIAYLNLGTVADNLTVPTTLVEGDIFFHDTDATTGYNVRLAYTAKSFGGSLVNYSVAVLQNQNFFTQPNTISCSHNSQAALSVSQGGFGSGMTVTSTNTGANGAAFIIEQRGTGAAFVVRDEQSDPSPFTISNSGRVGIGALPDASAALKVDVGGIMFNDGTTQTTAAGLSWTEAQVNTYALGAAFASVTNNWSAGATSMPDTMTVSFTFPNAYVISEMLAQAGISARVYGLEISGSYDTFDQPISITSSGSVTVTQNTSTYLNGRTYDIYLQFQPNGPTGTPVQFYVGQYLVA